MHENRPAFLLCARHLIRCHIMEAYEAAKHVPPSDGLIRSAIEYLEVPDPFFLPAQGWGQGQG